LNGEGASDHRHNSNGYNRPTEVVEGPVFVAGMAWMGRSGGEGENEGGKDVFHNNGQLEFSEAGG